MVSGKTIITTLVNTWDVTADFQRQTFKILAKNNRVVVIVENEGEFFLKRIKHFEHVDNIIFYTPIYFLPFKRFKYIDLINKNIAILWLFLLELSRVNFSKSNIILIQLSSISIGIYSNFLRVFTTVWTIYLGIFMRNLINYISKRKRPVYR